MIEQGDALRDWLVTVARDHSHEEAVDLFVAKISREGISLAAVHWASEALTPDAFDVINEGVARLLADRPPHWR